MGDSYQHRRHNKNVLMLHLILCTRYRRKILAGKFKFSLKQYIYNTCVQYHWYVKTMETDSDHLHILLQFNPTDSVTEIVTALKQQSTYYAWKEYSLYLK